MRVAICLLNAGGGHMEAARNIERSFKEQNPGADVRIFDGLALAPRITSWLFNFIWLTVQNKAQWLWKWMYNSSFFSSKIFDYWMYTFPWGGLRRALVAFNPDIVVNTHYICTPLALRLRRKKKLSARVNYLITEFIWHPSYFWWPDADAYYVASEEVRAPLLQRGYPAQRIHKTGIPIKKVFGERIPQRDARAQLGFPQDAKILFFFAGTFGGTALDDIIAGLKGKGVYPVVVAGKNEAFQARIQQLLQTSGMDGKVYGYVDFMNVIMSACDFMVGKGGALLCSECLALGVPIILYGSPPGHELGNAEHLEKLGAGKVAATIPEVLATIEAWLNDPRLVDEMRKNSIANGFPRAGDELAQAAREEWQKSLATSSSRELAGAPRASTAG